MKGRHVILDTLQGRRVAALLVDGVLDDLLVDPIEEAAPSPGTIFRAKVARPVKGQGGVFVTLPAGETGFVRQPKGLRQGDTILVQVTGYSEPGKAVPLTTRLLFKSKFALVTPGAPGLNISRQIKDEDTRARLRSLIDDTSDGPHGLILRSDADQAEDAEICEDIEAMQALAQAILDETSGAPERLLDGPDCHALAWREWGHPDQIDTAPGSFADLGVLDRLETLRTPETSLPGHGSIVVEPTRALIAVDVNTGGDTSPAAALKANLDASRHLPRALRLRGLGGQITVDFAPVAKKDRRMIEQSLKSAFRSDPIDTTLVGWTPLGHFEAQRKRERLPFDPSILET